MCDVCRDTVSEPIAWRSSWVRLNVKCSQNINQNAGLGTPVDFCKRCFAKLLPWWKLPADLSEASKMMGVAPVDGVAVAVPAEVVDDKT